MVDKIERPNTLIITVPDDLFALPFSAFVDKLVGCLGEDNLRCVQFVPKHFVRVTFTSFDARNSAFQSGIFIDSVRLPVVEADPVFKDVYLEHLPDEVSDDAVRVAFRPFGAVHEISRLKHAGSSVYTGTRLLKVALACDVPVNLRIMKYPCRVFYNGQPRPCSICRSPEHRALACPLRGVCRVCREPGHFARDCPGTVPVPPPVAEVPDEVPDEVTVDESVDDDDVVNGDDVEVPIEVPDESVDDDVSDEVDDDDGNTDDDVLASGDEEVLRLASAPSDSPRRLRSSAQSSVPMDLSEPYHFDRPRCIQRLPDWVPGCLTDRPHSSDTHVAIELYNDGFAHQPLSGCVCWPASIAFLRELGCPP